MSNLPIEQRHCFDFVTQFCHYCCMSLQNFVVTGKREPCPRVMEPIEGHQQYLHDKIMGSK